jgi:ATP synthase protein I
VVRLALVTTLVVGLVLGLVAGLTGGAPAVVGVAIGTLIVCLFFGLGAIVLDVVATLAPAASLLIALLTYTLKVVLIGLVFVGLKRSGLLESDIDARWLGGAVIAGTLTWLAAQVYATTRLRIPVYDLPSREAADEAPAAGGADASRTEEAGER